MYVHTRLLGLDIELGLHRAVRDLSHRSHARLSRLVHQCALSGLTLMVIALTTIVTLVWLVTAVAQNRALQASSTYEPIPVTAATPVGAYAAFEGWSLEDQDLWAVQEGNY